MITIKPLIVTHRYKINIPLPTIKSPITYLDQAIVSVDGMNGCKSISSIEDVISYITLDNTVNTPVTPDNSGKRVNSYYDVARFFYGLIPQR